MCVFTPQFKYTVVCITVLVLIRCWSHWLMKLCRASWMNWRLRLYRNESFFSGLHMLRWSTFTSMSSPMPRSETKPELHISICSLEKSTLVLRTCRLSRHHEYFDHGSDVCGLRFCKAHHLKIIFFCDVHETFIQTAQRWWIWTKNVKTKLGKYLYSAPTKKS